MSPTRRQFLAAAAAAVTTRSLIAGETIGVQEGPFQAAVKRFSGFKVGLQSYTYRNFNRQETIRQISELGLSWVEFFSGHLDVNANADEITTVRDDLRGRFLNMYSYFAGEFTGDVGHNRRYFDFARRAQVKLLVGDPAPESFPILHDLVQEYDIKVGIHNHGPNTRYDRIEDSLNAVERFDKRIGFCPDTGHCMRSGEDPVEMVRLLKDRLYSLHIKDQKAIHRNEPPETILGEGALDLPGLCKALRDVGFKHPLSIEYELSPNNPTPDLHKALNNFAKAAKPSE